MGEVVFFPKKINYGQDIADSDFWDERHKIHAQLRANDDALGTLPDVVAETDDIERLREVAQWYEIVIMEMKQKLEEALNM